MGAGWHLARVLIDSPSLGKQWLFKYNEWIDKSTGDGELEKLLYPSEEETQEYAQHVPYELILKTSDVRYAGTDSNVFVVVYGKLYGEEKSYRYDITQASDMHFERGDEDKFSIEIEDVGEPYKIRLGHDGKGSGSAWHVESCTLVNTTTKELYFFECNQWIGKDKQKQADFALTEKKVLAGDNISVVSVDASLSLSLKKYRIEVYTGDVKGAGTDANVSLTVCLSLVHVLWNLRKMERWRKKEKEEKEMVIDREWIDLLLYLSSFAFLFGSLIHLLLPDRCMASMETLA